MSKKPWNPYVAGVIIGLLQVPAILLVGKTLGTSGSYRSIADWMLSVFHHVRNPMNVSWWHLGVVAGIVGGVYFSHSRHAQVRCQTSPMWEKELGIKSHKARFLFSLLGGALMVIGARLANGCTSGNGISGTAQLDVSAWIVLAAMFASAVVIVHVMKFVNYKGNR